MMFPFTIEQKSKQGSQLQQMVEDLICDLCSELQLIWG